MIELECKSVVFYAPEDEAAFFSWAQSIAAVVSVSGRGRSIMIAIRSRSVSDASLRSLIGLFKRYRISMPQLAQFKSAKNSAWFASPAGFWASSVFGRAQPGIPPDVPAAASRRQGRG